MALTYSKIKQLASFQLHATESVVYAAPTTESVEVGSFWFHNAEAGSVSATVYFPFTDTVPTASFSSSLEIQRLSEQFVAGATLEISPKIPFILEGSSSDKITMAASQSGSISCVIYGRTVSGSA